MLDILTEECECGEGQDVNMGFVGFLKPARDHFIGQFLLQQMGAVRSYVLERQQPIRIILISEIYSPPRITREMAEGKRKHIAFGFAMDLTVNDPSDDAVGFQSIRQRQQGVSFFRGGRTLTSLQDRPLARPSAHGWL